jgi:hypothetical protein
MKKIKKAQEGLKINYSFKKVIGDSTAIKNKADSLGLSTNTAKDKLQKRIQQIKAQGATKMKMGGSVKKK